MRSPALVLAVVASAVVSPQAAQAGSYVATACSPSQSAGLWAPTNTLPSTFSTGNLCGGPVIGPLDGGDDGGLYAQDILGTADLMPDGARAGWTLTAPAGTTISGISYYRTLAAHGSSDMAAALIEADGTVLEQCTIEVPLGSSIDCSHPNNQAPARFFGLNTSSLFVGVTCRWVLHPGACGAGGTIHAARAVMYSAAVTLSENSMPTVRDVGGAMWSAGTVSGVAALTFAATDPSGIREVTVRADTGATLASTQLGCDFMLAQPCPQQPNGTVSVDTRRVGDGAHTFSLVVTDAAGNTRAVTSPMVVVDNYGPPEPGAFTATAQGRGSNEIAVAWRDPESPPAPITGAMVQLCQASCPAAVLVGSGGAARITAPGPGLYAARLWLVDSHGRGGPHNAALASVTVSPPVAPAPAVSFPARRNTIRAVLTGRRLRVSGTLALTGRASVSWSSRSGSRPLGHGSRTVAVRDHALHVTFALNARARRGTTRVVVRMGRRVVAAARARRDAS